MKRKQSPILVVELPPERDMDARMLRAVIDDCVESVPIQSELLPLQAKAALLGRLVRDKEVTVVVDRAHRSQVAACLSLNAEYGLGVQLTTTGSIPQEFEL